MMSRSGLVEPEAASPSQRRGGIACPPVEAAVPKSVFIHRLFTAIAPRYDWFNRLASLGLDQRWRRRAVAEGGLTPGMNTLDVCTGTGDLALLCAQRLQGRGLVVGLDFNRPMLTGASGKRRGAPGLPTWMQGDAQRLPFRSGAFDRVFIGFSTRNLSDLREGFCEMLRVLTPGGQLVVLETGYPANPLLRAGYLGFLATAARCIGWVLTGRCWPFTYLAQSVKKFLPPAQVVALIDACGAQARYHPLSWGLASLYVARKPGGA